MAVPTIISLSPASGTPYGNYMVTITGTNFRIPDILPFTGEQQESVRIWVGGNLVPEKDVYVRSETQIDFKVPLSSEDTKLYPLDVDVIVSNIDALGSVIVGETVTETDGFQYKSMDITVERTTKKVIVWMIRYLKRNLNVPVVMVSNVDYLEGDEFPKTTENPAIYLIAPRRTTDSTMTQKVREQQNINDKMVSLAEAEDFSFDVIGYAQKTNQLSNLEDMYKKVIQRCPSLPVLWQGETFYCKVLPVQLANRTGLVNPMSSLQQFQASFIVKGIPAESDVMENEYEIIEDPTITTQLL